MLVAYHRPNGSEIIMDKAIKFYFKAVEAIAHSIDFPLLYPVPVSIIVCASILLGFVMGAVAF